MSHQPQARLQPPSRRKTQRRPRVGPSPWKVGPKTSDTTSGRTYRIEYKTSLDELTWRQLKVQVAGGSTLTVVDDLGPSDQRFYRIVQLD